MRPHKLVELVSRLKYHLNEPTAQLMRRIRNSQTIAAHLQSARIRTGTKQKYPRGQICRNKANDANRDAE